MPEEIPTTAAAEVPRRDRIGDDWPGRAVDLVDLVVDTIRDRVIRPIIIVGRAVVFGLLIATLVLVVAVVVGIAILRLLDVYLFPTAEWASFLVLGIVVTAIGLLVWTKRTARGDAEAS